MSIGNTANEQVKFQKMLELHLGNQEAKQLMEAVTKLAIKHKIDRFAQALFLVEVTYTVASFVLKQMRSSGAAQLWAARNEAEGK